ncbi:uncharacterized protein LOC104881753 isoform X2 [Vitis vinifera]|uniref:uncharacterized protein LOC104881753 isoform X2 n=1 Tax=Vitis vinifera TaxID=29760 RepID=UPI002882FF25|nr:uncharacterized protein LOC104881753 isoform X2 [Vitis vinifera]
MFPPVDDPPDLGIPPNRGPLPVRRNPNSKPNPRVCSGHRRNAQPQGIRGVRAHRGSLRGILDGFFYFYCFVSYLFLAFYRENLTSFPRKSPATVSFPNSSCDKRCFLRLTTLLIEGSHPTAALCPSGQTLAFVPAINAMPGRRGFWGPELTEALYEWSFLDGIKSGTSLKFG